MKQRLNELRLRQMDESIAPWIAMTNTEPPRGGWIRSIREALGMSASQLGSRMGLTRQAVADLERREGKQAVTLAALEKAASAMNAKLVYAIVPRATLADTLHNRARAVASKQLNRAAHTMRLEAQEVSPAEYEHQLADGIDQLLANWSRHIWDEEDSSQQKQDRA